MATPLELDAAVQSAAKAQVIWANTNPQRRSRIMFAYKQLVEAHMDELAVLLSSEHGKALADSRADVIRGIDVIEFACGIPHGQKGEHTYGAGPEIDVYSMRKPLGPVVTGIHRDSIKAQVTKAVDEGATLLVDGRDFSLQGYEDGFFIGPSLLDNVTPDVETYQDEIFGSVLQIVRANTFEEALKLPSEHQYGNGVAIFTQNGRAARVFADRVEVGMVGINVPIPVPVAYHSMIWRSLKWQALAE